MLSCFWYNNNSQFQKWNSHRKFVGKTVHLKHETEYHIMQEQLNYILYTVNSYIIHKHPENGIVSPFLHCYVHKRSGKKTCDIYTRLDYILLIH